VLGVSYLGRVCLSTGLTAINGLGSLQVTEVTIGYYTRSGENVTIPFTITAQATNTSITASAKVLLYGAPPVPLFDCREIEVGPTTIYIPGTPVVTIDGTFNARYDPVSGQYLTTLNSITINNVTLRIDLSHWLEINTGIAVLDAILNGVSGFVVNTVRKITSGIFTPLAKIADGPLKTFLQRVVSNFPPIPLSF
jgi:hypothetical protein